VYIVLVNWNGWQDTIECLESVFHLDYPNFAVVVCDNGSTDGSLERIRLWAQGKIPVSASNPALARYVDSPVPKPIVSSEHSQIANPEPRNPDARLVLIQVGHNLGFAGGSNVGLRYALTFPDVEFAWLLNNDTVVRPDALSSLVDHMRRRPDAGMCGSTLLYYSDVNRIQACGGATYNRWFARGTHIGTGLLLTHSLPPQTLEQRLDYVVGASMLVRRSFLEQVGLLNEEYFLYFEEIDWATRAAGKFTLAYSPSSIVYHKEGCSVGSSPRRKERSLLSERYAARSRLIFTKRYFPEASPLVIFIVMLTALHRLLTGFTGKSMAIMNSLLDCFRYSTATKPGPQ